MNEGNFYALDARTGAPLWQFQVGGLVRSNATTFLVDAVFMFALP